jgi:hypothetical protein
VGIAKLLRATGSTITESPVQVQSSSLCEGASLQEWEGDEGDRTEVSNLSSTSASRARLPPKGKRMNQIEKGSPVAMLHRRLHRESLKVDSAPHASSPNHGAAPKPSAERSERPCDANRVRR